MKVHVTNNMPSNFQNKNIVQLLGLVVALLLILPLKWFLFPALLFAVVVWWVWAYQKQQRTPRIRTIDLKDFSFNILKGMKTKIWSIVGAVVVVMLLVSSVVIVQAGTTGVVHLFGKVYDDEVSSGIHLVNPLAGVEKMSIRTEDISMTKAQEGGQNDAVTVLTKEGLAVTLDLTILYHLKEPAASDVYKNVGLYYRDSIIMPTIRSAIRQVIAEYEAKDVYSEKRAEVATQLKTILAEALDKRGFVVEDVLLRDVQLPEKLAASIQEKLSAEQEAQRYNFTLETAKKEADRKRIEAAGQRDAQKIINESLTPQYLNYQYIQSLKDRQGTIYVPVNPANGMPLFQNIGR